MEESRRYRIGYLLAAKKKQSFIRPSLVNQSKERGIDLVEIDQSIPLLNQGPFDCVLHKCYSEDWKSDLLNYSTEHPGTPIIDDFSSIERLHNRITMLQFVTELQIPQESDTFGIPNQVVVHNSNSLVDSSNELKFPIIAKPLVADGSAKSHKMELVYNKDGLLKLKPPLVLQEFVNHGGVVFKVYVVGDYVKCVRRKSLPDVSVNLENLEGSMAFSQISNISNQDKEEEEQYYKGLEEADMPPAKFVTEIGRGLRRVMGLHLFNFDMIRDVKAGNHYFVIDINYFPGFAKMPSYEKVVTDFFWNIVHNEDTSNEEKQEIHDDCKMEDFEDNELQKFS